MVDQLIVKLFVLSDDDNIVELDPIPGWDTFQHTYINASYIDVSSQYLLYYCCLIGL